MKKFINNLLDANNSTSSKRFSALLTLATLLVLSGLAAYKNNGTLPQAMFDSLLIFIASCFGLTSAEQIFKKTETTEEPAKTPEPEEPAKTPEPEEPAKTE
jgi:hypothetical protein